MVSLDYGSEIDLRVAPAQTLTDLFTAVARAFPERVALSLPSAELSYRELDAWTDDVAQRLRAAGAGPGEYVGVRVSSGTAELYGAILAVLKSGAAYVPVDAEDPQERIGSVFDTADVLGVLDDRLELEIRRGSRALSRVPHADDDAWVIFTSGTTGTPKGVAIQHRAAAAFVQAEHKLWRINPDDRVLAGLSVSFDASCEEMWAAWSNGAALVPIPRSVVRTGVDMGPWIRDRAITVVSTVPTLAALWGQDVLAGLRLVILGGEALSEPLGHRLAAECEVWNTYGPTEATVVSTAARVLSGMPISIGYPLEGWLTALVDECGYEVPTGEPGELVIGGVGLGRYLDTDLDSERYAPLPHLGWARGYRSGDMARETASGYEFIGRRDDQVKIGGRRIELGEVDAHLSACEGVVAAAACVQESTSGNKILVGYVVPRTGATLDTVAITDQVARQMSGGVAPLVVQIDDLPQKSSGKVDRKALPWPPPEATACGAELGGTAAWLLECWRDELGALPLTGSSNFFHLGGGSLAAARLVNALRQRFPDVAIADIYEFPEISNLAAHLDSLGVATGAQEATTGRVDISGRAKSAAAQLVGVGVVLTLRTVPWMVVLLAAGNLLRAMGHGAGLPRANWWALAALWLALSTTPGRAVVVALVRRTLAPRVAAGRYSRHSWLGWRLWFLQALGTAFPIDRLAGTPWAVWMARLAGLDVDPTAHLMTLPSASAQVRIGARVTIEEDVDLLGWHVEGSEIVVGTIQIEDDARVARRAMLHPGVRVGRGAEIMPASVVATDVPAGERWDGSVAGCVGQAGDLWASAPAQITGRALRGPFIAALVVRDLVPWVAAIPLTALLLWVPFGPRVDALHRALILAPAVGVGYFVLLAITLALTIRLVGRWVRPGWYRADSAEAAANWLTESLMADANTRLFSLFSSSFARRWLLWCGVAVGSGTEVSTTSGLNRLVSYGELCFSTDAIGFASGRTRGGWTERRPIAVGDRSFLGNTSTLSGGTTVGKGCLVGLQSVPPADVPDGTTWLGVPAFELPRAQVQADLSRTLYPALRLRAMRRVFDLVRICVPSALLAYLATAAFVLAIDVYRHVGLAGMLMAAPIVAITLGVVACLATISLKWMLIGRYRVGSHPFFSTFVWRDELLNSCQEMVAGPWLLGAALGTPVINIYLRLMGARIGRGSYIGTLATYEYDQVVIGRDAAVNRAACVQTHLFQDRVMQIGQAVLGDGSSVGPHSAILLDTKVGTGTHIGMGSVLMRGEHLPGGTRWAGVPIARQR